MCRLDFGSVASAPDQHQQTSYEAVGGDDAVEALLALACDTGMDYGQEELVVAAQHAHAGYSAEQPTASTSAAGGAGKASAAANDASSRYHCPFPGCKRSFAELWRLKVHYRAPPNIRGSGKERGHGMRLTHCPKCGAALKVGGHHVKCAAVTKEPAGSSAAGRRNRKAAGANAAAAAAAAAAPAAAAAASSHPDAAAMAAYADVAAYTEAVGVAAAGMQYHSNTTTDYMQYTGLPDMMQQEAGGDAGQQQQSLWHKALQLHAQQQQQLQHHQQQHLQQTSDELQSYSQSPSAHAVAAPAMKYEGSAGLAPAQGAAAVAPDVVGPSCLWRAPSSDDSSSSRMMATTDGSARDGGGGYSGSGTENNWGGGGGGPSSSSGSGSDDMDGQQQQHPQQNQSASPQQQLLALFGRTAAGPAAPAAAAQQQEAASADEMQQQQKQAAQAQHPEAGQIIWQHMLLQHLQQHVQQTPGLSLPDLIQVAAALFGDKVDTLVSAFGLSGTSAVAGGASTRPSQREQAQLSQLAAVLGHGSAAAAQEEQHQ